MKISVPKIILNPNQPRKHFKKREYEAITRSMGSKNTSTTVAKAIERMKSRKKKA